MSRLGQGLTTGLLVLVAFSSPTASQEAPVGPVTDTPTTLDGLAQFLNVQPRAYLVEGDESGGALDGGCGLSGHCSSIDQCEPPSNCLYGGTAECSATGGICEDHCNILGFSCDEHPVYECLKSCLIHKPNTPMA